jgi:hypothetical protein
VNEYDRILLAMSDIAGWGLFALLVGGLVLLLVLAALFVERLLPPRVDRQFTNLSRNTKGRRAMAARRAP